MRKTELLKLKGLPEEIETLKKELLEMQEQEYVADVVKDGRTGYPKPAVIAGLSSLRYKQEMRRLQNKIIMKEALVDKFEEWVETVPDADMRRILRFTYKYGLKQKQVARAMGDGWTRESVGKRLERFFAED